MSTDPKSIPTATPDADSLRKAEEHRRRSMLAGDIQALDEIISTAFLYVHATGATDDKASYLSKLKSGYLRYELVDFMDVSVKLLGSVGMIFADMRARVARGEILRDVNSSYLAVWNLEGNGWQLHAIQATPKQVTL